MELLKLFIAMIALYTRCYGNVIPETDKLPIEDVFLQESAPIQVRITVYNPVPEQCDSDPLTTASGARIDTTALKLGRLRWLAVSRDLLATYSFGDTVIIYISDNHPMNGSWVVKDVMNKRYKNSVDLLTYNQKLGLWDGLLTNRP